MITGATTWPELDLTPDPAIADSQTFHRLKATRLERADEQHKNYLLICDKIGLKFEVQLTGILSEYRQDLDPYRPGEVLADLRRILDSERGSALSDFLRYSPWLIADLNVKDGGLSPVQRGVMLARLLELFVVGLEESGLIDSHFQEAHALLLRARFIALTQLYETYHEEVAKYLPDVEFQVRESWRAWGRTLYQSPQDTQLLLDRCDRHVDDEGARLLFADEAERRLWPFATTEADLPFTRQLLGRWFLPRYDVRRTMLALGRLPGRFEPLRRALPVLQPVGAVIANVVLSTPLLIGVGLISLERQLGGAASEGVFDVLWGALGIIANSTLAGACLLALITTALVLLTGTRYIRYTLPRITLAIIAGYVALVSSGEIMTFAIRAYDQHPSLAIATAAGTTLLAFGAIYVEARQRLNDGRMALGRAGLVLLIAAARSLTLGWLILAPAGSLLLAGNDAIKDARVWDGWIGNLPIYPQLIFILAPLALFIGIFVQTIWEEYPLTRPI